MAVIDIITAIILALVVVSIGIQYYFMRFQSLNIEKTDILVTEKMDNMKTYIEESISGIFESDEDMSQEEQQKAEEEQTKQFVETVTVAMVQAFQTNEMRQTITEIIAPIAPSVLPPEDMAKLGVLEGSAVVNMISGINPFMPKLIENFMGENWQQEVQKNPQMFVALLSKLQQSGALNVFQSFLGGNSVPGGNPSQQIGSGRSNGNSGW